MEKLVPGQRIQVVLEWDDLNKRYLVRGYAKMCILESRLPAENNGETWDCEVLRDTKPNEERKGAYILKPIQKVEREESWEITDSQYVVSGIAAPQVKKIVKLGSKVLSSEGIDTAVLAVEQVSSKWPEEIRRQAAERVARYRGALDAAVAEIQWPEYQPGVSEIVYDDGTLHGRITMRVEFRSEGLTVQYRLLDSVRPIPSFYNVIYDGIHPTPDEDRSRIDRPEKEPEVTTLEQLQAVRKVLGEAVSAASYSKLNNIKLCWGAKSMGRHEIELLVKAEVLTSDPQAEWVLEKIEDENLYMEATVLLSARGLMVEISGIHLSREACAMTTWMQEGSDKIRNLQLSERNPLSIKKAHFHASFRQMPVEIRQQIAQGIKSYSLSSWTAMYREYLLHGPEGDGKEWLDELNDLLDQVELLTDPEKEVKSYYRKKTSSEWEPKSPDGMRGGKSYTIYVDVPYYGIGCHEWRREKLPQGSTQQEIKAMLLKERVLPLLQRQGEFYSPAFGFEASYADPDSRYIDAGVTPVEIEGLKDLQEQNARESRELLEKIEKSLTTASEFVANVEKTSLSIEEIRSQGVKRYNAAKKLLGMIDMAQWQRYSFKSEEVWTKLPHGDYLDAIERRIQMWFDLSQSVETPPHQAGRALSELKLVCKRLAEAIVYFKRNSARDIKSEAKRTLDRALDLKDQIWLAFDANLIGFDTTDKVKDAIRKMRHFFEREDFAAVLDALPAFEEMCAPVVTAYETRKYTEKKLEELRQKYYMICPFCGKSLQNEYDQDRRLRHQCIQIADYLFDAGLRNSMDIFWVRATFVEGADYDLFGFYLGYHDRAYQIVMQLTFKEASEVTLSPSDNILTEDVWGDARLPILDKQAMQGL